LTQYELSVIQLGTDEDAQYVSRRLDEGVLSFASLAESYSLDPSKSQGGQVGFLTRSQIQKWLGNPTAMAVVKLPENSVSLPLQALSESFQDGDRVILVVFAPWEKGIFGFWRLA